MDRVNDAILVRQGTTLEATVGVFGAGTIPYYSERRGIDFLGKVDPYIARLEPNLAGRVGGAEALYLPGHNKLDLEYSIKKLRPTYVEFFGWGDREVGFEWGGQSVEEWGKSEYAKVRYEGHVVDLLKGSADVNWHDIKEYKKASEDT